MTTVAKAVNITTIPIENARAMLAAAISRKAPLPERCITTTINPGATSTKLEIFSGLDSVARTTIKHQPNEIPKKPSDDAKFRAELLVQFLYTHQLTSGSIDAIVGRGGSNLKPVPSGIYIIDEEMLAHAASEGKRPHPSNLGALLAYQVGEQFNVPVDRRLVVDPITTHGFDKISPISGDPEWPNIQAFHALNHGAAAKITAAYLGKKYEEINLVVAHMGGGITIGAHHLGRVIDNNERQGGILSMDTSHVMPAHIIGYAAEQAKQSFKLGRFKSDASNYEELEEKRAATVKADITDRLLKQGGITRELGTNDLQVVYQMIDSNNERAGHVYAKMVREIAGNIAYQMTVLAGNIEAVVLTGGMANSERLVKDLATQLNYLRRMGVPIIVVPGDNENFAMAIGAANVIGGAVVPSSYKDTNVLN
ncbi:MAG: hypothetical protein V1909_02235 [Candidatus Micrarchaeota archaeon]